MNNNVKKRLYFFLVSIITALIIGKFIFDSLKVNSVYFFSPTDLKNITELPNGIIRIGGMIKIKSLKKILNSLGFKTKVSKKNFNIEIPSWRPDVKQDIDIIEELIRIKGFDKI